MEAYPILIAFLAVLFHCNDAAISGGMLYPRESESRQIQELGGMWNFRADMSPNRNEGMEKQWYKEPLKSSGPVIHMPVPSSYNDITTDRALQNFVGWVWYERNFFTSSDWQNRRVVLRIDSAHYYSKVWVNGHLVTEHNGGHLPFEAQVNSVVNFGGENRVTVAVNNTLTPHTLPPGSLTFHTNDTKYPPGYFVQNVQFDFFNYAGIHRHVRLYTTPMTYVDDITVVTDISGTVGVVQYAVEVGGDKQTAAVSVEVVDLQGKTVASGATTTGEVHVADAHLWWPYSMEEHDYGYMYDLKVTVKSAGGVDIYRQPFGIRTVNVTQTQFLINGKPFYCQGFGKHEDSDIRGKGLDYPLIARDFHMLKWLGANCFRTSHYPYAEEILDEASRWGIAIIDESPGVGITQEENFSNESLQHHLEVMEELVRRDKNKPCVIMWSVANEPASDKPVADHYFKTVIGHTKALDGHRPVVFVISRDYNTDKAAQYVDVICINRYYGWYSDTGHFEVVQYQLSEDLQAWYNKYKKPMIVTEYGADTVAGLHTIPSFVFTEDYQVDLLRQYHNTFDIFRKKFLVGEMLWNFADFMTVQSDTRVVGNKKGVLTRQRQPKTAARLISQRYWHLIADN